MVDSFVKIVTAIASLINSLAWPIVAAWLIWKFAPVLRDFLSNMSEGSLKAFGVEASAKRKAAESVALADLKQELPSTTTDTQFLTKVQAQARQAENLTQILPVKSLRGKRVLWIDDHPEGNYFERRALEDLGLYPYTVTDPEQAMRAIAEKQFSAAVVVPEHIVVADSWKTLEGQLQKKNIPVVVYDLEQPHNWSGALLSPVVYSVATDASGLLVLVSGAIEGLHSSSDQMQNWAENIERVRKALAQERTHKPQ